MSKRTERSQSLLLNPNPYHHRCFNSNCRNNILSNFVPRVFPWLGGGAGKTLETRMSFEYRGPHKNTRLKEQYLLVDLPDLFLEDARTKRQWKCKIKIERKFGCHGRKASHG